MTRNEVIAALVADTEKTEIEVRDFLQALSDLCAETLEKGDTFPIATVGQFSVNPSLSQGRNGVRAPIRFTVAADFRERLRLEGKAGKPSGGKLWRVF